MFLVEEGYSCQVYKVSEDLIVEMKGWATFTVCVNQDDWEIKCNCRLFEFRGILCRHAVTVLIYKKVDDIPKKYILQRWMKDVKRCHTKVKVIYSDWTINPENERFDTMCNTFYQTVDKATDSENKKKLWCIG